MTRIKDLGCGLLTVLLITLPVWVVTASWRGPIYAVRSLFLILAAVILTWPKFPRLVVPGFLDGMRKAFSFIKKQ